MWRRRDVPIKTGNVRWITTPHHVFFSIFNLPQAEFLNYFQICVMHIYLMCERIALFSFVLFLLYSVKKVFSKFSVLLLNSCETFLSTHKLSRMRDSNALHYCVSLTVSALKSICFWTTSLQVPASSTHTQINTSICCCLNPSPATTQLRFSSKAAQLHSALWKVYITKEEEDIIQNKKINFISKQICIRHWDFLWSFYGLFFVFLKV